MRVYDKGFKQVFIDELTALVFDKVVDPKGAIVSQFEKLYLVITDNKYYFMNNHKVILLIIMDFNFTDKVIVKIVDNENPNWSLGIGFKPEGQFDVNLLSKDSIDGFYKLISDKLDEAVKTA